MTDTKQTSFTPGPWLYKEPATKIGVRSRYGAICYISISPLSARAEEGRANARLIAAAPTMAEFIAKHAASGNADAVQIMEKIHGR